MTNLLDGKVVLISGAGPGLGRSCAAAALAHGARGVALGDLDGGRAAAVAAELDPTAARTHAAKADICSTGDIEAFVAAVRERWGSIDSLVHVAAYDTPVGGLLDGDLADWDRAAAVNVRGTLELTRAAVPLFGERGGSVVIIGTIGAVRPRANSLRLAYGASKGALLTAARYLAVELGPRKIRVNTVAPGYKWGPVLESYLRTITASTGRPFDELVDDIRAESAMGEIATDDDIADTVVYLCSDLARKVTAQVIHVDAGGYIP
jgi:NAD(P)-dependent dehydrogenase (short-subunit alcohol dehydrogenase family)